MPAGPPKQRIYPVMGREKALPPDFERVTRRLTLKELAWEIEMGKGTADYQRALSREVDRRRGL